ncbi:MAG TPA: hypothetical protein VFS21_06380 [Roseiflexaceae bacterium]|nr:hypothetical protein [Roseiflexaceae bacterium]
MSIKTNIPVTPLVQLILGVLLLVGCTGCLQRQPQLLLPTPTPLTFTLLPEALRRPEVSSMVPITTVGYLYVDAAGARLLDRVSMSVGTEPQPLSESGDQIWIEQSALGGVEPLLRQTGTVRYAVVLAQGQIEGPGRFGPEGEYRFLLRNPQLETIAPQEITLSALLTRENASRNLFVRLNGALIAGQHTAYLVERIGPGGIPTEDANQLDLAEALGDEALIAQLQAAPGGQVRFGQVQVEGLWRGGRLIPLGITPIR